MITEENKKMLDFLADALHERTPAEIPMEQWPAVHRELSKQAVLALPSMYIGLFGMKATDKINYMGSVAKNVEIFYRILDEQQRLLDLLDDAGIPAVVLKGAAAAMYYPHPEYRSMGDIDLIVQPEDFERAYLELCAAGYTAKDTLEDFHRHIEFRAESRVQIELHKYFSSSVNADQNRILDARIYDGISRREYVEICGYRAAVLPKLENGLVLLAHINQHLWNGIGLRQIIDWMMYVERDLDDTFWVDEFEMAADTIGMKTLAKVVSAMCQKYLGLSQEIRWCNAEDETLCNHLMEFILGSGNFMQKDETKVANISFLRFIRNPIKTLQKAQKRGEKTWPILKKYPVLKPFCWIYQVKQWAVQVIKCRISFSTLLQSSKMEKKKNELLRQLKATRYS